jgi:hypothetical protein
LQVTTDAVIAPADIQEAFSFKVAPVRIVEISHTWFEGHVYNLSTVGGWYVANNIITHNCGWTFHDDGDLADGSRRTIAELRETPLSHPNCVRLGLPVL